MVTRKALNDTIRDFLSDLRKSGVNPTKVVLFGSYASGQPHALSDIDLAIWNKNFIGCGSVDIEPFVSVISRHRPIEVHTFAPDDTAENNPFVAEILKHGVVIDG
jgi:predicted nucleotidyltransferase